MIQTGQGGERFDPNIGQPRDITEVKQNPFFWRDSGDGASARWELFLTTRDGGELYVGSVPQSEIVAEIARRAATWAAEHPKQECAVIGFFDEVLHERGEGLIARWGNLLDAYK